MVLMTQLSFYIVSDVHGYIFPTDFSKTNQQLPMGLLYANLLIEQSSKNDDIYFKNRQRRFPTRHLYATI